MPAGELASDEWVGQYLRRFQQVNEAGVSTPEMINPNGGIDEHRARDSA
jgi:hypothetical protein